MMGDDGHGGKAQARARAHPQKRRFHNSEQNGYTI